MAEHVVLFLEVEMHILTDRVGLHLPFEFFHVLIILKELLSDIQEIPLNQSQLIGPAGPLDVLRQRIEAVNHGLKMDLLLLIFLFEFRYVDIQKDDYL